MSRRAEFGSALATVVRKKCHEATHAVDVESVNDRPSITSRFNQARVTQFFEMERKGGFGNLKLLGDITRTEPLLSLADQKAKDLKSRGLGQSGERGHSVI